MTSVVCVIPARMASARFPGKPLKPLLGLPLVMHVFERCRMCDRLDRILIATCDEEIRAAAASYGAETVMTGDSHPGCSDRTQEAVAIAVTDLADDDLVLMVQGDEVLVTPQMLDDVIATYEKTKAPVVNIASKLTRREDHEDPNTVKVVAGPDGRALYYSRAAIPSAFRADSVPMYQQTGIIGFSSAFLKIFGTLEQTPLEKMEHVDMLRVIENGLPVQIVFSECETIGVDTPGDLARAETILAADPLTKKYLG